MPDEELPPVVTRLTADIAGLETGLVESKALITAWKDDVGRSFSGGGEGAESLGRDLGKNVASGLRDAEPVVRDAAEAAGQGAGDSFGRGLLAKMYPASYGEQAGADLADGITRGADGRLRDSRGRFVTDGENIGAGIGDGISKGVEPGLNDTDNKIKDRMRKTGQDAGAAAGQGISPLIIGALVGAGAIGGPLLVAGLGAAMVGATALILKQNQVISADFSRVGKDAEGAVEQAAAPLAGTLNQALLSVDKQVTAMAPDLKNLFAAAQPDIATVTSGLTGLVGNVLPGLTSALSNGQAIVTDFSASLPVLGSDVGRFFSGLVGNADLEGRALEATLNTVGNTVYTVGTLLGSAATAAAPAVITLTHALNGVDDALRSVGSPAVVGAAAGLFGAMKLGSGVQSGLLSGAESLSNMADKAEEAGGFVGKLTSVAGGASGALAKMADVAGGPWGLAIGAGIGLVSGLVGELMHADDATKAITVSTGQLADAIAQDNAKAGQATGAYIAQQAQASGLADEAKNAGVSLSLLTEAATGNQAALSQLTVITGQANDASRQQQLATVASLDGQSQLAVAHQQTAVAVNSLYSSTVQMTSGQNELNQSLTTGSTRLAQGLIASNSLTDANQQLLNSVRAQTQQVADEINKQTQLDAATTALNNTTNIFNATIDAARQKLVAKAQATADNTVAALNLGTGQSTLNQQLAASVQQYDEATGGANAYDQVLTAMNGTVNTLLGSEASFTIALDGVTKAAQSNGDSLDVNNTKGAQNIQTFTQVASSAQKAAVAFYQSEVNTKGASVAYQDANAKLTAEKQAFIDAADKAGFNKTEVKALADELYNLPHDIPISIDANTAPALQSVNAFISRVNASSGVVQVYTSGVSAAGGKALTYDDGGFVDAPPGVPVAATVHGREYVLSEGMLAGTAPVDPRVLAALRSGASGAGGGLPVSGAPGGGTAITVLAPIYLDGRMIGQAVTPGAMAETQNFARRNSITGFAGNYR